MVFLSDKKIPNIFGVTMEEKHRSMKDKWLRKKYMGAGIDPDEDNYAKISCHCDHINGEKQHKEENLQFLDTR